MPDDLITLEVTDSSPVWFAEEKRWMRRGEQITVPQSQFKRWAGVCKRLVAGNPVPQPPNPFRTAEAPPPPTLREKLVEKAGEFAEAVAGAIAGKKPEEPAEKPTGPLKCPHCEREFKAKHWLDTHIRNAHPAQETEAQEE